MNRECGRMGSSVYGVYMTNRTSVGNLGRIGRRLLIL